MQAYSETSDVTETSEPELQGSDILKLIVNCLDDNKAENIVSIDLFGKSSLGDYMVIASGRSQRQVAALADYVVKELKGVGIRDISLQGKEQADWILIDSGDVIVHLFRPEVRDFYGLDKMWGVDLSDAAVQQSETTEESN